VIQVAAMTKKRQKIYRRMAQEAFAYASQAKIASVREEWLKIAESYRARVDEDADDLDAASSSYF
jgi:hypothetical protein